MTARAELPELAFYLSSGCFIPYLQRLSDPWTPHSLIDFNGLHGILHPHVGRRRPSFRRKGYSINMLTSTAIPHTYAFPLFPRLGHHKPPLRDCNPLAMTITAHDQNHDIVAATYLQIVRSSGRDLISILVAKKLSTSRGQGTRSSSIVCYVSSGMTWPQS